MNHFWNWTTATVDSADGASVLRELRLEGTIAEDSWFDDDITPKVFRNELHQGNGPVTVWLNSPGGDCVAASQIYTMLREYPGEVTVKIDGMAASAASVIAMAGDKVLMAPTAIMMVHNPLTMAFGNRDDMKQAIRMLDEFKESIVNAYELKTGLSRDKISSLMDAETWMNAKKALELGFIDAIVGEESEGAEDAYCYSRMTAVNCLLNKMAVKEQQEQRGVDNDIVDDTRVSIDSLYLRLNKHKY